MALWRKLAIQPHVVFAVLSILAIVWVAYWPYLSGTQPFFHDSAVGIAIFGIFYDRLLGGDSWLWSTSLNGGHPLWLAIETVPFWDPVVLVVYSLSAVLGADWQTPYQVTVYIWLLMFAIGGGLCSRHFTRERWAGVATFVLLFSGPLASMLPGQSWGFLIPFRYLPFVLYSYLLLRRRVSSRHILYLSVSLAFSLAGYQSGYLLISLLFLALADLLIGRREFLFWLGLVLRQRAVISLAVPILAALPILAFLDYTQFTIVVPRIYNPTYVYFYELDRFVTDLFFIVVDEQKYWVKNFIWHGTNFFGHLGAFLLVHGTQRGLRRMPHILSGKDSGDAASFGIVTQFFWLLAITLAACGIFGLEEYVNLHGAMLGVRNFGFLLTVAILILTIIAAYGLAQILKSDFTIFDGVINAAIIGVVGFLLAWLTGTKRFEPFEIASLIIVYGAVSFLLYRLRNKLMPSVFLAPCLVGFMLVEILLYSSLTTPLVVRTADYLPGGISREDSIGTKATFQSRHEIFTKYRAFRFDDYAHWPYIFLGPAVHEEPSALMVTEYRNRAGRPTGTHFFRLRSYEALLTGGHPQQDLEAVLGVTRPILELVRSESIREEDGDLNFVLGASKIGRAESAISERPDVPAHDESLGMAQVTTFSGDRLVIEVKANDEVVLIHRDNYAPGWSATVDGETSELLVVDRVNKAVALSPGTHKVEFLYRPWLYLVAFGLRAAALLAAAVICVVLLIRDGLIPVPEIDQT